MAIEFHRLTHSFVKTMTDSRTVYVDGVGPVTLKHSNRVEKTTLTATPDKGVRVSVPVNVSFETAVVHRLYIRWRRGTSAGYHAREIIINPP
jgi:hypothetical protein